MLKFHNLPYWKVGKEIGKGHGSFMRIAKLKFFKKKKDYTGIRLSLRVCVTYELVI